MSKTFSRLQMVFLSICLPFQMTIGQSDLKTQHSGNPIFPGWYADPEGIVFGNEVWIYPTYSATYDRQVFFDAFSSK